MFWLWICVVICMYLFRGMIGGNSKSDCLENLCHLYAKELKELWEEEEEEEKNIMEKKSTWSMKWKIINDNLELRSITKLYWRTQFFFYFFIFSSEGIVDKNFRHSEKKLIKKPTKRCKLETNRDGRKLKMHFDLVNIISFLLFMRHFSHFPLKKTFFCFFSYFYETEDQVLRIDLLIAWP